MSRGFAAALRFGQIGESAISRWLIDRGNTVLPTYEMEIDRGKGPRVFSPAGALVSPDLCVIRDGRIVWVEAKHKTVFSWRRNRPGPRWETGVDLHHWRQYIQVQEITAAPVWLLFLHRKATPSDLDLPYIPPGAICPTGLFGISLDAAIRCVRECKRYADGMAYWGADDLIPLGDLGDVGLD